eukprot:gene5440-7199_t
MDVAHYFIDPATIEYEVGRLRRARDEVAEELIALKSEVPEEAHAELVALLDVHLMLLDDDELIGGVKRWITDRLYNAEWALTTQLEVIAR